MKSYRFLSLLTVLLVLDIAGLRADAVTPEQAMQIASQFFSNKGPRRMQSSARRTSAQSAMTTVAVFDSIDSAGQPYIYAVSAPQQDGFVLVSGDDRFNAVLGYSDGSSYDEQTMPENMRAWMQGYIAEMRYLESKGYRSAPLSSASPKAAISPLLTTKWNQGAPFNNNCPIDNSTQQRSVTGCVATAMAQVINYHIQNHNAPTQIVAAIPGYTTYTRGMYVGGIAAGTMPEVKLYLNDQLVGTKQVSRATEFKAVFTLPYQPGELRAEAGGQSVTLSTAGEPARLRLTPDKKAMQSDGQDLTYVTVEVVDSKGNVCPEAAIACEASVKGAGQLLAFATADFKDTEATTSPRVTTWKGRALLVVRSNKTKGKAQLSIKSALPTAALTIQSR